MTGTDQDGCQKCDLSFDTPTQIKIDTVAKNRDSDVLGQEHMPFCWYSLAETSFLENG